MYGAKRVLGMISSMRRTLGARPILNMSHGEWNESWFPCKTEREMATERDSDRERYQQREIATEREREEGGKRKTKNLSNKRGGKEGTSRIDDSPHTD